MNGELGGPPMEPRPKRWKLILVFVAGLWVSGIVYFPVFAALGIMPIPGSKYMGIAAGLVAGFLGLRYARRRSPKALASFASGVSIGLLLAAGFCGLIALGTDAGRMLMQRSG